MKQIKVTSVYWNEFFYAKFMMKLFIIDIVLKERKKFDSQFGFSLIYIYENTSDFSILFSQWKENFPICKVLGKFET